jgi:hypothetical protein
MLKGVQFLENKCLELAEDGSAKLHIALGELAGDAFPF